MNGQFHKNNKILIKRKKENNVYGPVWWFSSFFASIHNLEILTTFYHLEIFTQYFYSNAVLKKILDVKGFLKKYFLIKVLLLQKKLYSKK